VLRNYEQVLLVLTEPGMRRRRILVTDPSGGEPSNSYPASAEEFAQLCLAACAKAIAARNTVQQLPECLSLTPTS
jgi:hypothetical protein